MSSKAGMISIFNALGYNLLEIDDKYYVVTSFDNATSTNPKHYLVGKDVTDFIKANQSVQHLPGSESEYRNNVNTKILNMKDVKKQFHSDYLYILHLSGV